MKTVECRYLNGTKAAVGMCEQHLGPAPSAEKEECSTGRECSAECKDSEKFKMHCEKVLMGNLCYMENLKQQCCETCQKAGFV